MHNVVQECPCTVHQCCYKATANINVPFNGSKGIFPLQVCDFFILLAMYQMEFIWSFTLCTLNGTIFCISRVELILLYMQAKGMATPLEVVTEVFSLVFVAVSSHLMAFLCNNILGITIVFPY